MKKIKGLRWFMIGLVAIGIVINYLDRNALSVGASTINKELGTTTQQYSYIVASFQASYAIMQPFAGNIIDFLGTKTGLAIFAIGWSIVSICHAFVGGWFSLAFLRGLLGVSESAVIPASIGLVDNIYLVVALIGLVGFAHQTLIVGGILPLNTDVFGHKEVATAGGLNGGLGWAGTTIFTLLIGTLVDSWGYNPMFVAISCFDVIGAIIVWNFLQDRPANLGLNKTNKASLRPD